MHQQFSKIYPKIRSASNYYVQQSKSRMQGTSECDVAYTHTSRYHHSPYKFLNFSRSSCGNDMQKNYTPTWKLLHEGPYRRGHIQLSLERLTSVLTMLRQYLLHLNTATVCSNYNRGLKFELGHNVMPTLMDLDNLQ
jgi:hypothetical protein